MKRTLSLKKLFVSAGAILLSMQVTQAQIYREIFGNVSGSTNENVNTSGWAGVWGATATDASNPSPNNFGISASPSNPNNLLSINTGQADVGTGANGYLFTSGTGASLNNWFAYGSAASSVDQTTIQDISIYAGSAANGTFGIPGFRLAVQVGGNWYATTAVFANSVAVSSGANFGTQAQQLTFTWTTAASAWDSLTAVPGTSLVLGSTLGSPLPAGNITGFGIYSDQESNAGNATRRVDTFQVDAVPEPGSVVLALSGVGMLMGINRFRKA